MIRTIGGGGIALLGTALALPAVAQDTPRATVAPYIEVSQAVEAALTNGDQTVTYTSLAAGIDASVATRRVQAQVSYRYEHRFGYGDYSGDEDVHSGLGRIGATIIPGLSVDAGALATRTRSDIRGDAPGLLIGNTSNVTQLYSVYGGPTVATHAGPLSITGLYRLGYTKVEAPGSTDVPAGQPRLDYFDSSLGQTANLSVGVSPGTVLPVGLTASGGWNREDASQLDQRYDDLYARGDVLWPVTPHIALAGGVGYEKLTVSQRDPLLTAAGTAVLDGNGRYVTNPASPRRIAYRTDGVYFDAGVVWRPSARTSLGASVGRRYGSISYTGNLTYQASRHVGVAVNVYDNVETFGHQLTNAIAALPTSFVAARDAYSQQFNGCVFSTSGTTPGGCLNDVFQSVTTASYRTRGVDAVVSVSHGLTTWGGGVGYTNRHLFAPDVAPGLTITGLEDQSYYAQLFLNRQLSRVSGIDTNVFVNYYDPGVVNSSDVWSYGATGTYYHNFGRLGTTATLGIYNFKVGELPSNVSLQALLAARYTF